MGVDLDQTIEIGPLDLDHTSGVGHRRVDLGQHDRGGPDQLGRRPATGAKAEPAVGAGGADLDDGHVDGQLTARPVQAAQLRRAGRDDPQGSGVGHRGQGSGGLDREVAERGPGVGEGGQRFGQIVTGGLDGRPPVGGCGHRLEDRRRRTHQRGHVDPSAVGDLVEELIHGQRPALAHPTRGQLGREVEGVDRIGRHQLVTSRWSARWTDLDRGPVEVLVGAVGHPGIAGAEVGGRYPEAGEAGDVGPAQLGPDLQAVVVDQLRQQGVEQGGGAGRRTVLDHDLVAIVEMGGHQLP